MESQMTVKEIREMEQRLREPFPAHDIQWMPQTFGGSADKPWVMVLAYVDARALQERLDEVFSFAGWKDSYIVHDKGIICNLSVRIGGVWVAKENGAPETHVEAFKGGISSAFKRVCASGFGIGRYLYNLDTTYANCQPEKPSGSRGQLKTDGWNRAWTALRKGGDKMEIWWRTPQLPEWALPGGSQ